MVEEEIMDREQLSEAQYQQVLLCLATEHSALQSARSTTVSETNGRVSLFLGTVSSTLIALGFLGQGSASGASFFVFGLVLFPALFFLGLATFVRVLQASIEDLLYARGINRIRHFYLELAPQMRDYFILAPYDDMISVIRNMGVIPSRWQLLLTAAGMVAVINSVLAGVLIGVLIATFLGQSLLLGAAGGFGVFLVSVVAHEHYQRVIRRRASEHVPVLFPSPVADEHAQPHG